LTFRLTLDEFEKLVSEPCHYCGENPGMGIDRVDNRIGYLQSNVVASCSECNFMKRVMLEHRFINRALKIAAYQKKKQEALRKETPQGPSLPYPPQAAVGPETQSPVV